MRLCLRVNRPTAAELVVFSGENGNVYVLYFAAIKIKLTFLKTKTPPPQKNGKKRALTQALGLLLTRRVSLRTGTLHPGLTPGHWCPVPSPQAPALPWEELASPGLPATFALALGG